MSAKGQKRTSRQASLLFLANAEVARIETFDRSRLLGAVPVAATLYSRIASFRLFSDHHHSIASDISVIHHLDGGTGPKSNCEEEKKMNKQMTPAEIEVLQQSFARFAPLSEKATLVGIESGPLPPPNVPAALALAGMTMK